MSVFRRVSATDTAEAIEVAVSGSYVNPDGTIGLSVGNITSWPDEVDYMTYARKQAGEVDEATRVVWLGHKDSNDYLIGTRTGGSASYLPDSTNFATVVPTHRWANDMTDSLNSNLAPDGERGILVDGAGPLVFAVSDTEPSPIAGRTILWLRPLG
jgi:hypothetical protein